MTPEDRTDGTIVFAVNNRATDLAELHDNSRTVELSEELEESGAVPELPPPDGDAPRDLGDVRDAIVAQLSPRCREVYLMVNEDGFTYKQVAAALGIGPESVKTYLKRANICIREALVDGGYRVTAGESPKALKPFSEASND
jgi:RNA polymerase sigma-70 factor (ECF subfamily)